MPSKRPKPESPQTELVIGLVGAVGIDLKSVVTDLRYVLSGLGYRSHDIHLTEQLPHLKWRYRRKLREEPYDERVWSYMSAGNRLCERWDRPDAFALLAVNAITLRREKTTGDISRPADRHAYILRSLKRREEAELLREIYGSRFILLSIYAPLKSRKRYLSKRIRESRVVPYKRRPVYSAKRLIARDEAEAVDLGQDVRGIFHRGDFFVDAAGDTKAELKRIMEILFGHPNRTPTRDEFGMFQAIAAMRRSADLGRQVGAAICTREGAVVAVGTNEVPRAGGGLYWEGDKDDGREFRFGWDISDQRKSRIANDIARDLAKRGLLKSGVSRKQIQRLIEQTDVDDLIEFIRAVHAEMAALTDAARRGIAVSDAVLYATTFPCHHCARHVVASGIKRVVYISPYPKSLAGGLHDDSILVDPPHRHREHRRVTFEPFVGVGPSRYLDLFEAPARKNKQTGEAIKFAPKSAVPRLGEIEGPEVVSEPLQYVRRELRVLAIFAEIQQTRGPRFRALAKKKNTT
jgi:deoxycytidylate deaminase